jgi:hypothetical protein
MPAGWTAAAIAGSAALGAGSQMMGSGKSAGAAKDAANLEKMQYLMTRQDLSPFMAAGASALPGLSALANAGPTGGGPNYVDLAYNQYLPPRMTQAELEQTPGYQFTLGQGLKAEQSSAAARGLGVSGASLKGAAKYATGLADSTYQNQFNNAQTRFNDVLALNTGQQGQLTNQFQRLQNTATLGANAAAGLGSQGVQAAGNAGNALQAAGEAEARGLTNTGNALNQGVQNYLGYQQFQNYMNPQNTFGTSAPGTPGISASGNPVMMGFAPSMVPGQVAPGGFTAV